MRVYPRLPACGLVLIAAVALGLGGCTTYPKAKVVLEAMPAAQRVRAEENLEVFHTVWDLVNRKHYAPAIDGVDWEKAAAKYGPLAAAAPNQRALYRTLNEMLEPLHDSHTRALTPAQAQERKTRVRPRTGFSMVHVDRQWVVADVLPKSPAQAAGVQRGWVVLTRNGEALDDRPDFRAREGEAVVMEFLDLQNRRVKLTLQAATLTTAAQQEVRELEGGVMYLRFDEFDRTDRRWLGEQLRRHANAPAVIVDLRRNSGGDTHSLAISIGEFFDRPVHCGTFISRNGSRTVKQSVQWGSARYRGRVAVLVDASSASSAEIFAAVLKDQQRAIVVGRKTAGAVLASWFHRLPDGGLLQLSREDYIAPNGRRIETNGVEPDVVVTRTLADFRAGRDPDLEVALAVLRAGAAPWPPKP